MLSAKWKPLIQASICQKQVFLIPLISQTDILQSWWGEFHWKNQCKTLQFTSIPVYIACTTDDIVALTKFAGY